MSVNEEKLNTCLYLLNHCINRFYKPYKFFDENTFSEFTPCCNEEKKLLCETIEKALEIFIHDNNNLNENIIYWSVVYYYYITIVV